MTHQPQSDDVLDRLRSSDPASHAEQSSAAPEDLAFARMRVDELITAADSPSPRRRRALLRTGAIAAVGAIAVAVVLIGTGSPGGGGGPSPEFAAAAVKVAEANSRLLVTEPGWSVVRAYQFEPGQGEIEFSDGTSKLQITWYPARFYEDYREDRAHVPGPDIPITVLGREATMIQYAPRTDFATMLPPQGDTFVEIRGDLGSEEAYRRILDSLEQVDVNTWLSAMPASVVQPVDQGATIDAALKGVSIPPAYDLDALKEKEVLLDQHQLVEAATTAITCEWLDRWVAAEKAGDEQAAAASVEAMSGSRDWPLLRENADGNFAEMIWQISRQLESGDLDTSFGGAVLTTEDGKRFEYGPGYALALGCSSMHKVPADR